MASAQVAVATDGKNEIRRTVGRIKSCQPRTHVQSIEKEKRAAELIIAKKELRFQSQEKKNRAAELLKPRIVIMLTTSGNPDDQVRALTFPNVSDFKTKPLTEGMLSEIFEKYADRNRMIAGNCTAFTIPDERELQ